VLVELRLPVIVGLELEIEIVRGESFAFFARRVALACVRLELADDVGCQLRTTNGCAPPWRGRLTDRLSAVT
jgi:hypothetical protein